jgi:cystathionine beta-lyase/cystathionine gamma-synthase
MDEEKKAQWEERLAAHAVSGMTVIDWCRENGMTKHTEYTGQNIHPVRKVGSNQSGQKFQ